MQIKQSDLREAITRKTHEVAEDYEVRQAEREAESQGHSIINKRPAKCCHCGKRVPWDQLSDNILCPDCEAIPEFYIV